MRKEQMLFDRIITLLNNSLQNNIISELLNHYPLNEIIFNWSEDNSVETNHILRIHKVRQSLENNRLEKFIFGYEELMPSLKSCQLDYIKVFNITTQIGSYIIFTDVDLNALIGILKSRRTLTEIRKKYITQDIWLLKNNQTPIYNWKSSEVVFINGKLYI